MVLSEAILDFADYSRHELGHTRRTNVCCMSRLRHFMRWLEEQGHPDPSVHDITPELIRRYDYATVAYKLRLLTSDGGRPEGVE